MRRTSTALAAAALALALAGGLSACASDPDPSPSESSSAPADTAADTAALGEVTVQGDLGSEPTITLPSTPFTVSSVVARLVQDGDGEALEDGQLMSVYVMAVNGKDGTTAASNYEAGPEPMLVGGTQIDQLDTALDGAHVGARALLAADNGDDTLVYSVEVAGLIPNRATGEPVPPVEGLPTVTLDDSGKPSITPASGDAPTELVAQPLLKGDGAEVQTGQQVVVNYTGWLWDGTQFDSSWDKGQPFPFTVGQGVIQGWSEGVTGQTVGSQVLLVIPPDKGYGDQANGSIPANSTLVFVVDILAAQ